MSCRSPTNKEDEHKVLLVDTWKPAKTPGAVAAGSGNAGIIIESPPRHDWEIEKIESVALVPFYGASSEQAIRHQIGGPTALMMQQQLAITTEFNDDLARSEADNAMALGDLASLQESLGDAWDIYPSGLKPNFLPGLDPDVWEHGGRAKSYKNALRLRGVRKSSRRKQLDCRPRPCTTVVAQPPTNAEERARSRNARRISDDAASADMDLHPMFINAPPQPALKAAPASRSARFFQPEDDEEGLWGCTSEERAPTYRTQRRPRGMEEQNLWNTLNVPSDANLKKHRPGEVSHERVWSIAHALAEQLPALTAG